MPNALNGLYPDGSCQILDEDGERLSRRGWRAAADCNRSAVLVAKEGKRAEEALERFPPELNRKGIPESTEI